MMNGTVGKVRISYAPERGGEGPRVARPLVPGIPSRVVNSKGVVETQSRQSGAPRREPAAAGGSETGGAGRLVVGHEIGFAGEIKACDTLVVYGAVESVVSCRVVEVGEHGRFRGTAEVENATIAGCFEGTLTVRNSLTVTGSGRVDGKVRYGELTVETGGRIAGDLQPADVATAAGGEPPETAEPPEASDVARTGEPEPAPARPEGAEASVQDESGSAGAPQGSAGTPQESTGRNAPADGARQRFRQSQRARRLRELAESDA